MAFEKGKDKTGGRKKGSVNKKTLQWDALGASITNEHTERFNGVLNEMDDDKFADTFIKVLEYFKPKQNRTDITTGGDKINPPKITFF